MPTFHLRTFLVGFLYFIVTSIRAQEMCSISGNNGNCLVESSILRGLTAIAFPSGRDMPDARYEGSCTGGKLDGMALIRYRQAKRAMALYGKFDDGKLPVPLIFYRAPDMVGAFFRDNSNNWGITGCLFKGDAQYPAFNHLTQNGCQDVLQIYGEKWVSYAAMESVMSTLPQSNSTDDAPVFGRSSRSR